MIKKIMHNDYSISFLKRFITLLFGVTTTAYTVRMLGPELRGEQVYLLNFATLASLFFALGIQNSYGVLRKKNSENINRINNMYYNFITIQFIVIVIIIFFIFLYQKNLLYMIAMLLVPLNIYSGELCRIILFDDFKFYNIAYMLNSFIVWVLTIIVFVVFPKNLYAALSITAISYLYFIIIALYKNGIMPRPWELNKQCVKEFITLGFFPMLIDILNIMNYSFDTIMMKHLNISFSEIGLYSVGTTIAGYLWLFPDILKEISLTRSVKRNSIGSICFSLRLSNTVSFLMMVFVVFFGELIIKILFGENFLHSYIVTLWIILGVPSLGLFKILSPYYIVNGLSKFNFTILLISVLTNIILNLLTIPFYGIIGAAFSSSISYLVCGLVILKDFTQREKISVKEVLFMKHMDTKAILNFILKN